MNDFIADHIYFFNDFITYVIPIITSFVVIVTAIAGCWKYFHVKKIEKSEKILRTVYLPIMQYLIKQETLRTIMMPGTSIEKYPILSIENREDEDEDEEDKKVTGDLHRGKIIDVTRSIDLAVAPRKFIYLLSMYEMLCAMKENYGADESTLNLMAEVEYRIKKETINGFLKYHRRVAIDNPIKLLKEYCEKPDLIKVWKSIEKEENKWKPIVKSKIEIKFNLDELKKKFD